MTSTSDISATGHASNSLALYVHIPFCETKCPYCDFNTYSKIEPLIPSYVSAILVEIENWGRVLERPYVHSVFFGGGTPSYLPAEDINLLMTAIRVNFNCNVLREATLEANPGDLTDEKLLAYREAGLNRLSIGVQSLDDGLLALIGRRHSAEQAVRAYQAALDSGFDNVSIDLMYGLPYQSLEQWERTLKTSVTLRPPHISMYCLTLEPGTPMQKQVETGRLPEPNPDLAADMYKLAEQTMKSEGYRHYEISNWAHPGNESIHNLTYWRNLAYLGVGPGAHSYLEGHRFWNLKSPAEYVRRLESTQSGYHSGSSLNAEHIKAMPVVKEVEIVDRRLEMAETMMMGIRLDIGIAEREFAARFGLSPHQVYPNALARLQSEGLIDSADGSVQLTARGRLLGDEVFSRFLDPA